MRSNAARMAPSPGSAKAARGRARAVPVGSAALGKLRKQWGMTAKDFARITGFSERAIASWEAGSPVSPPAERRLVEVQRLLRSLAGLVREGTIPGWLHTPNEAFGGLKPLEVVERGEIDRLWRMVYHLESGTPT